MQTIQFTSVMNKILSFTSLVMFLFLICNLSEATSYSDVAIQLFAYRDTNEKTIKDACEKALNNASKLCKQKKLPKCTKMKRYIDYSAYTCFVYFTCSDE